jgi:membrane-associated protein
MQTLIDLFIHLDKHLVELAGAYGPWLYGLLFLIVFAETGLVVTPFLPGDSLLFATGALAATGVLNLWLVVVLLLIAAILGDAVNYAVGRYVGPRIFTAEDQTGWLHKLLNREHLRRAHEFFER